MNSDCVAPLVDGLCDSTARSRTDRSRPVRAGRRFFVGVPEQRRAGGGRRRGRSRHALGGGGGGGGHHSVEIQVIDVALILVRAEERGGVGELDGFGRLFLAEHVVIVIAVIVRAEECAAGKLVAAEEFAGLRRTALLRQNVHRLGVPAASERAKARKTLSWPRNWAKFSLLWLYSHRNAWANLHVNRTGANPDFDTKILIL